MSVPRQLAGELDGRLSSTYGTRWIKRGEILDSTKRDELRESNQNRGEILESKKRGDILEKTKRYEILERTKQDESLESINRLESMERLETLDKERIRADSKTIARKTLAIVILPLLSSFSAGYVIFRPRHGTENSIDWWESRKRPAALWGCSAIISVVVYVMAGRFLTELTSSLGVLESAATDLVVSSSIPMRSTLY